MGWNDHVDWDEERIKEIKQDKKETAQMMRKHGMDEETIRSDRIAGSFAQVGYRHAMRIGPRYLRG